MDTTRVRYTCPVDDCDWVYTDWTPLPPAEGPFMTVAELVKTAALQHAARVEAVLAKHVESHTPVDFLRTIHRLNQDLATAQATARSGAQSDQR